MLERYAAQIADHDCEASTAVMTSAVRDAANGDAFRRDRGRALRARGPHALRRRGGRASRSAGATAARPARTTPPARGDRHRRRLHRARLRRRARAGLPRLDPDRRRPLLGAVIAARPAAGPPSSTRWRPRRRAASRPPCRPTSARAPRAAIAVAGTATSCAAIDLALDPYDAARVEGHVLSRATLAGLRDRLAALPLERAARGAADWTPTGPRRSSPAS